MSVPTNPTPLIDAETLDLLRCPLTRSRLRQDGEFLVAEVGGLAFYRAEG